MTASALWILAAAFGLVAAIFFLRFHRATRDAFFAYFSAAFAVLAVHFLQLGLVALSEQAPQHFILRLVAFGLIALAIIVKNRG